MNIDKMYQDFLTNIAPKIQEGLVITKDYFVDLFGRYVKYLIVIDLLSVIACIFGIIIVVCIVTGKQINKIEIGRAHV